MIKRFQYDWKALEKSKNDSFSDEYLPQFDYSFSDTILQVIEENHNSSNRHYFKKELTLLNRILDYKENYFMLLHDFNISYDNGLVREAIHGVKSKIKYHGNFKIYNTLNIMLI